MMTSAVLSSVMTGITVEPIHHSQNNLLRMCARLFLTGQHNQRHDRRTALRHDES